jgi:hypothetical protein
MQKTSTKKPIIQQTALEPDVPFLTRLAERLTYLRNRRWVQVSFVLIVIALAVWGFFYVRSLLPRTPAQLLDHRSDSLHTQLKIQEAVAKLDLIRAMIQAGRQPDSIERYRGLLANDLEAVFESAPKELKSNWSAIDKQLNELQVSLNEGNEEALASLLGLEAVLQGLLSSQ